MVYRQSVAELIERFELHAAATSQNYRSERAKAAADAAQAVVTALRTYQTAMRDSMCSRPSAGVRPRSGPGGVMLTADHPRPCPPPKPPCPPKPPFPPNPPKWPP
jgi:hypothetical protein